MSAIFLLAAALALPSGAFAQAPASPPPPAEAAAPAPQSGIPDGPPVLQLEPLVITAPRLRLPPAFPIDPQINSTLLRLLAKKKNERPDSQAAMDASIGNLNQLATLDGYNLKVRYTQLGFLLTEGLAGVTDFELASELQNVAQHASNVQIRAAAMNALAYTHDMQYANIFQAGLTDPNLTVRFGALEALLILGDGSLEAQIANAARGDPSVPLQVYASAGMWRMGDIFGRESLLRFLSSQDWLTRAMSVHYIGELGGSDEYDSLLLMLANEGHPIVKAELCSALLRLQKFKKPL